MVILSMRLHESIYTKAHSHNTYGSPVCIFEGAISWLHNFDATSGILVR